MDRLVSVIIPCFNHGQYIKECVDSVLSQTYKNVEIILIDDGSTDNTKAVLSDYINSSLIKYFYQENQGLSKSRNNGLKIANGFYVKFLDSDDFLYPKQIAMQVNDLENSDASLSVTRYALLMPSGKIVPMKIYIEESKLQYASFIEACRGGGPHSFLIKKDAVMSVGGFDEDLNDAADLDIWIRILSKGYFIVPNEYIGCCYRVLEKSMSSDTVRMFKDKCKVYEKVNRGFLALEGLPQEHLLKRLMIINPKMLYECWARKLSLDQYLPYTMDMTSRIYQSNGPVLERFILGIAGVKWLTRIQYWIKNLKNSSHKDIILNEKVSWKFR